VRRRDGLPRWSLAKRIVAEGKGMPLRLNRRHLDRYFVNGIVAAAQ
jgi:hypothetical protein